MIPSIAKEYLSSNGLQKYQSKMSYGIQKNCKFDKGNYEAPWSSPIAKPSLHCSCAGTVSPTDGHWYEMQYIVESMSNNIFSCKLQRE